jgi:tetratricopeptide (TPR) repeat protein
MQGEHMKRVLNLAFVAFALFGTWASAADLKPCLGSTYGRIEAPHAAKCEKLAIKGKLTNRERAQIYLQLAFGKFFGAPWKAGDEAKTMDEVFRFAKASVRADNTYGDAYLALADFYQYKNIVAEVLSTLDAGAKNSRDDIRVQAEYAAHFASPFRKKETEQICLKVTTSPNVDQRSYFACGKAAKHSGLPALAEIYLYKAMKDDKIGDPARNNDIQFGAAIDDYVDILSRDGRGYEAAKVVESILSEKPFVPLGDWKFLAELLEKVGDFEGAAKYYGIVASNAFVPDQFGFKLRQVISLARASKPQQSLQLAERLFENSTLQQVLRLQVNLKNGSQKDLVITGKFDDQTKKALSACIKERGCFEGVSGKPI